MKKWLWGKTYIVDYHWIAPGVRQYFTLTHTPLLQRFVEWIMPYLVQILAIVAPLFAAWWMTK